MIIKIKCGDVELHYEHPEQENQYNPACSALTREGGAVRDNETLIKTLSAMTEMVLELSKGGINR